MPLGLSAKRNRNVEVKQDLEVTVTMTIQVSKILANKSVNNIYTVSIRILCVYKKNISVNLHNRSSFTTVELLVH